jgi:hypothetical protein
MTLWLLGSWTAAGKHMPCAESTIAGSHRGHTFPNRHTFGGSAFCVISCALHTDTWLMYMPSLMR